MGVIFEYQFDNRISVWVAVFINWVIRGLGFVFGGVLVVYGISGMFVTMRTVQGGILSGSYWDAVFSAGGGVVLLGFVLIFGSFAIALGLVELVWRADARIDAKVRSEIPSFDLKRLK